MECSLPFDNPGNLEVTRALLRRVRERCFRAERRTFAILPQRGRLVGRIQHLRHRLDVARVELVQLIHVLQNPAPPAAPFNPRPATRPPPHPPLAPAKKSPPY